MKIADFVDYYGREWRPQIPPPPSSICASEVFFPGAQPGRLCLCLNGALFVMLIYLFLSFYLAFSLYLSFFFFFFWHPFSDPGDRGPQNTPPGYAPAEDNRSYIGNMCAKEFSDSILAVIGKIFFSTNCPIFHIFTPKNVFVCLCVCFFF